MALQLNLLHEEISEQRQRQRDPLKLGVMALIAFGALLFLYYGWNAYRALAIKRELNAVEAEWQKVEPKVTAAQKRAEELRKIIDSSKVLDGIIDARFYWAPFLSQLAGCVGPNIQLLGLDGDVSESTSSVHLTLEGVGAAPEPRAAAEEFRHLLGEKLMKSYSEVKVDFRSLEDLDTSVNIAGVPTPVARFILNVSFNPKPPEQGVAPRAPEVKEAAK